jgi:hypothetical protein
VSRKTFRADGSAQQQVELRIFVKGRLLLGGKVSGGPVPLPCIGNAGEGAEIGDSDRQNLAELPDQTEPPLFRSSRG